MRNRLVLILITLAGLALTAVPASAQVRVIEEEYVAPAPRVVEERVVVRPRPVVVRERVVARARPVCRIVARERVRPNGTVVVRKVRRCD